MITETTRDNALIAAANGKTAFVITQKGGYPDVVNLTKLLGEALTEKDNIFIADIEAEVHPEPSIEPEEPDEAIPNTKPRLIPARRISRGRKSGLDDGKIMALHKAGWPDEKIADEMGVTTKTIDRHLDKMGERGKP